MDSPRLYSVQRNKNACTPMSGLETIEVDEIFLFRLFFDLQAMLRMNTEIPAAKRYERVEEVIQEVSRKRKLMS